MITNIQRERYIWLIFLIGSILLWKVVIPAQIHTNQNNSSFGPDLIPNILTIGIMIISGLSFIGTFIYKGKEKGKEKEANEALEDKGNIVIGMIVFVITIGYTYIIDYVHFISASIICMFLIMWVLSVRKWYMYLIMLALIFLIKFIFEDIMYINLP